MKENCLIEIRQHFMKYIFRVPKWIVISAGVFLITLLFYYNSSWAIPVLFSIIVLGIGLFLEWVRFQKSKFVVTNLRVYLTVMKGMTGGFEVGLHYRQIKNCTFRKHHLLHTLTNSGTLYLRAGGDEREQIAAEYVPNVEQVCKIINWLLALTDDKGEQLSELPDFLATR